MQVTPGPHDCVSASSPAQKYFAESRRDMVLPCHLVCLQYLLLSFELKHAVSALNTTTVAILSLYLATLLLRCVDFAVDCLWCCMCYFSSIVDTYQGISDHASYCPWTSNTSRKMLMLFKFMPQLTTWPLMYIYLSVKEIAAYSPSHFHLCIWIPIGISNHLQISWSHKSIWSFLDYSHW